MIITPVSSWLLALVVLLVSVANGASLPESKPVPGGIAVLPLGLRATGFAPQVEYRKQRVMVLAAEGYWVALVGIPLDAQLGSGVIQVRDDQGSRSLAFTVQPQEYQSQYLTLKNQRQVEPNPADLERIQREQAETREAFGHYHPQPGLVPWLELPVNAPQSSPFGLRRFFNNQPRAPHSGIDLAAARGTPVHSPAPGQVIRVGDYFFNGRTVFLDHGEGLVTLYCHLEDITVREGQWLAQGEVLGHVGSTGRATGPHLHWSVSLNDARIDPALLLSRQPPTRIRN